MTLDERKRLPACPLVIDAAYAGLPGMAHGGYVAGVLTAALAADSSRIRLRRPVPPAQALRLERPHRTQVELHGEAGLLADGADAEVLIDAPERVAPAEALSASRRFPGMAHHPYPGCVCCGPAHPRGLRVFPGPVSGRGVVAALWVPAAELADGGGDLPSELVCAALDCPQLWALMLHAPATTADRVVTAVLETRLDDRVVAGEPHVVMGWPIGRDGRRWLAGAAIFGPGGELCAVGRQTAAVVGGWGVPLGRDRWAAGVAAE
jgi:hypothetical protein